MSTHDFTDCDSIEELKEQKEVYDGWAGADRSTNRIISEIDDEIERRIRLSQAPSAGMPQTTAESSHTTTEDDSGQWDHLSVDGLRDARSKYASASQEADVSSGYESVVDGIDEELARRDEFGVAELSAGAIEQIGTSLGPETKVSGIAIGADDVTLGKSGKAKKWGRKALSAAASSLEGTPLVRDHENDSVDDVVGKVTRAYYDRDEKGVAFEAEVDEPRIAQQIDRGRLDVSARVRHAPEDDLPTTSDGSLWVRDASDIRGFDNLSVVTHGASGSSEIRSGGL